MPIDLSVPLRQSAIASASCLKRFHDLYEVGGINDDSDESRRGTAFHAIALNYYIPALVEAQADQDFELLGAAFEDGVAETKLPAHLLDEVWAITLSWGETFELDRRALLSVEERRAAFGASGQMDLVYVWPNTTRGSVCRVTDFKTYRAILNEDAVRREFQGKLYTRIAMEHWPGFDVYEFAMAFPRYGSAETVVEYSPDELDTLDRQVRARLAVIEQARAANDWPAQPGEHCGLCRLRCDVADDPRVRAKRIADGDEAKVVGGRALVGTFQNKADLAALRAWCMTEGPVQIGGMEYAHTEAERQTWDVADVIQACRNHDVIPPEFVTGKTALKPLIGTKRAQRAHPELVKELEAMARKVPTTRFGARKAGDVAPHDAGDDE